MKGKFAKNINRYRKEKGLTQDGLAQYLGVTELPERESPSPLGVG